MNDVEFKKSQEIAKHFGRVVRQLRESKGLQQNELAEMIGCSPQRLCGIESGKHFPLWPMVKKLASALEVSADIFPG